MTAPQQEQQGNGQKALEAYIAWRLAKNQEDQESIAAWLNLHLYPLWAIQRFTELDASTPLWVSAALPAIKTAYLQSQRVQAVAASDVRFATEPDSPPLAMVVPDVERPASIPESRFSTQFIPDNVVDLLGQDHPVVFDDFPMSDVATSLMINGNYEIKAAMPGDEDDLMYSGLANSSGAATRQAINGARGAMGQIVYFDKRIRGYARVTDGNPCWFCGLLASRGAVFKKDSFDKGGNTNPWSGALTNADKFFKAPKDVPDMPAEYTNVAKVHNHCKCTLRPVYMNEQTAGAVQDAVRDPEAQFYFEQWTAASQRQYGKSNRKVALDFRENYRPYKAPPANVTDVREELAARRNALTAAGVDPRTPQAQWVNTRINQLA